MSDQLPWMLPVEVPEDLLLSLRLERLGLEVRKDSRRRSLHRQGMRLVVRIVRHGPLKLAAVVSVGLGAHDDGGHLTPDRHLVRGRGRRGEIINVGGVKVHPLPIEERVSAVPGVDMARVHGRPNPMTGAIVALEVVAAPGSDQQALKAAIRAACEDLPAAARPRSIRFVDDIVTFADVMASDSARFNRFFHLMLEGGVYLAPSAFEAGFTSIAHGDRELEITFAAAERAFAELKKA